MSDPYITPLGLATRWNMTLQTLAQWRWNGRGPQYLKLGRNVRYRQEDIYNFESKQLYQNTSQLHSNATQLRRLRVETLPRVTPLRRCPP